MDFSWSTLIIVILVIIVIYFIWSMMNSSSSTVISGSQDAKTQTSFTISDNSYSFALSPEEHQPSGTCNFSRIDNAVLQLTYNSTQTAAALNLKIYAVNYNVLRIMSGMGGLAYSN